MRGDPQPTPIFRNEEDLARLPASERIRYRLVGAQPILLHGRKSDFMLIQDGEGTFMSGGELVGGKPGGEDQGDMRGDSIRGGVSRVLKPGDVMFVPAGIPHGFVETKDHVTFVMLRFDSK